MEENKYLLEMRGISKYFPGVKALQGVDLLVRPGTANALIGENGAGKSTLMKCLFGIYTPDEGKIFFNGREVNYENARDALDDGVSMVHQELNQVMARSVMENIWLGRFPCKGAMVDHKKMYHDTKEIFDNLGIDVDPRTRVDTLSVSQRQMLEIAKAVSYDAKLIVFDEPTSSLTEKEVAHLFKIINNLKSKGVSMIYITHKMDEVFQIADDITILRDGQFIRYCPVQDIRMDEIISLMVGRNIENLYPPKDNVPTSNVLLKVENLSGTYQPTVHDASFELHEGEILGIAGLVGSRRTELVETIYGLRKRESGNLYVNGKKIENRHPRDAIKNGFALLTEERRATGIFTHLSIEFNAVIAHIKAYGNRFGVLRGHAMAKDTQNVIDTLKVKTPSMRTKIGNLSGGNQQKVLFGRWLINGFKIFMLDEPTRGIDVGAKYEIYQIIINEAKKGNGIIVVSSEMPELLGIADRILVMSNGRVAGILDRAEATQEEILKLSIKYL